MTPAEVVEARKAEATQAARVLGVRIGAFLDGTELKLRKDSRTAARLRDVLERERPEIIYVPFPLDRHADHRATTALLIAATCDSALNPECRGYEVWTPLLPNCVVGIDATIRLKESALRCYPSQLTVTDYLHSALGLSAYRALSMPGHGVQFAEAFYTATLADYGRLYDALA